MKDLILFLKENFIWHKIERDKRNHCYYIHFWCNGRIITETLYSPFTEERYNDCIKIIKVRKDYWEKIKRG